MFIILKPEYFQLLVLYKTNSNISTLEKEIGIIEVQHFETLEKQ